MDASSSERCALPCIGIFRYFLQRKIKRKYVPIKKWPGKIYYYLSKYAPDLLTILIGLRNGTFSLGYICILMLLGLYIYAVAGILFLRDNDPWHFRSLEIAIITLIRCAFFDVRPQFIQPIDIWLKVHLLLFETGLGGRLLHKLLRL